jgi:hypothetical protein
VLVGGQYLRALAKRIKLVALQDAENAAAEDAAKAGDPQGGMG